jgi:hypothetical protein
MQMKKTVIYFAIALSILAFSCKKDENNNPVNTYSTKGDSLISGAGYANDVYYSLKDGVISTRPKSEWDLAFATISRSVSILINSGNKDSLFVWKGGKIANFNSASTLNKSRNLATSLSDTSWYNYSAFEQNVAPGNVYDAGWGIYNSNTHDVVGDSVYILKLSDGTYKKIAIINRSGTTHDFVFKIANLAAGAPSDSITIHPGAYSTKNFVYYSVATKQIVDREPDKSTWDFVFTKYDSKQAGYPLVTGILTNEGTASAKINTADSTIAYKLVKFSKVVGNIGFDWKHFNGASYDIVNPFYYVKTTNKEYYRLKLKSFDFSVGKTVFQKKLLKQ